ncbi:carboxylesterase family protein [Parafilimonas terrae]|uniref:Prolyl oligopeptidase family protein n=1 Tax=Parafilimonas terrae TaxID=1465490 RepID=A0A1I5SSG7_9BACT|nr:hypothetical protein [Parafilimonas terrae]SFP73675.1 hypothetical protein SAMN05444277_101922 [Parafilimonas terrae]
MRKLSSIVLFVMLLMASPSCKKETAQLSTVSAANESDLSIKKLRRKTQTGDLVGRQQQITIATGDYTYPTSQALLWLPAGYNGIKSIRKKYPLIIALDGVGEQGTDIKALLHSGTIAYHISKGWDPVSKNPADGKDYSFIVFTPQCPVSWGWSAPQIKTMLASLKKTYRIDVSRVYLTGFSAGGWGLWSCMTDDVSLCQQFAAIGPVSSAAADHPDKITNVAKFNIACWNICGTADSFYGNAVNYTNIINGANPKIPAILTSLKGVGHSAWNQAYDTSWRVNKKNFFEWALQYRR